MPGCGFGPGFVRRPPSSNRLRAPGRNCSFHNGTWPVFHFRPSLMTALSGFRCRCSRFPRPSVGPSAPPHEITEINTLASARRPDFTFPHWNYLLFTLGVCACVRPRWLSHSHERRRQIPRECRSSLCRCAADKTIRDSGR